MQLLTESVCERERVHLNLRRMLIEFAFAACVCLCACDWPIVRLASNCALPAINHSAQLLGP